MSSCILTLLALVRFDSDQDGVVSVREVAMVFRSIGCSPTEAELQVIQNHDRQEMMEIFN